MPYFDVRLVWAQPPSRMHPEGYATAITLECVKAENRDDARKKVAGLMLALMSWKIVEVKEL